MLFIPSAAAPRKERRQAVPKKTQKKDISTLGLPMSLFF
jgi:hypothetical protein